MHIALTTTVLNMRASNLPMVFNRIENAKNISLRMVKAAKKKGKYVEIDKIRNEYTGANTWTLLKYGDFSKESNVIRISNLKDLKNVTICVYFCLKETCNMFNPL